MSTVITNIEQSIVEGDVIHSVIFPELGVATEDIFRL